MYCVWAFDTQNIRPAGNRAHIRVQTIHRGEGNGENREDKTMNAESKLYIQIYVVVGLVVVVIIYLADYAGWGVCP